MMIDLLIASHKKSMHILSKCEVSIAYIKFINAFNNIKNILLYE